MTGLAIYFVSEGMYLRTKSLPRWAWAPPVHGATGGYSPQVHTLRNTPSPQAAIVRRDTPSEKKEKKEEKI